MNYHEKIMNIPLHIHIPKEDIIKIENHDFTAWCNQCNSCKTVERVYPTDKHITDYLMSKYFLKCIECQSFDIGKECKKIT